MRELFISSGEPYSTNKVFVALIPVLLISVSQLLQKGLRNGYSVFEEMKPDGHRLRYRTDPPFLGEVSRSNLPYRDTMRKECGGKSEGRNR